MPITEVDKIWMNGEFVDWPDATIHVLSHGLHYGSGVFEGIRAYASARGPAIWHLDAHLDRMFASGSIYHMELPYSKEELIAATKELIRVNRLDSCYIRPIAFRGYGEMGVNPLAAPVDVAIAVWPWGAYLGEEALEQGARVQDLQLEAPRPELAALGGQGDGDLPRVDPCEGRGGQGRLRRGDLAEPSRDDRRGLRRERLRRRPTACCSRRSRRSARSGASPGAR